jgi:hypothetical protein
MMNKKIKYIIIFLLSLSFSFITYSYKNFPLPDNTNNTKAETQLTQTNPNEEFIKNLDITKYETNGTDYANPKYNPERIGKRIEEIDIVYDYDFARLAQVEKKLEGIDRKKALKAIFYMVTKDAKTDLEKHLAILRFLGKSSFHNKIQPMYPDKTAVYDPLVLLELSEMRCGHVARIAIDLFNAAGYRGRLVQAGGHVLAEIAYGDSYHYFDADLFSGGQVVVKDGKIPSIAQLSNEPYLLDQFGSGIETFPNQNLLDQFVSGIETFPNQKGVTPSVAYPSYNYFYRKAYTSKPIFYEKTASTEQTKNKWYGWNHYVTIVDSKRKIIEDNPIYYIPGSISYKSIVVKPQSDISKSIVNLEWSESEDLDRDLLGYKVFISKQSRGWNNIYWQGEKKIETFNHNLGVWKSQMYDFLFKEPPHNVLLIKTRKTKVNIELTKGKDYYITIMPYDQHGESVGRVVYPPSNEIKISL